jgi:hypothetical protein
MSSKYRENIVRLSLCLFCFWSGTIYMSPKRITPNLVTQKDPSFNVTLFDDTKHYYILTSKCVQHRHSFMPSNAAYRNIWGVIRKYKNVLFRCKCLTYYSVPYRVCHTEQRGHGVCVKNPVKKRHCDLHRTM